METTHRIFIYAQHTNQAGKVLTESQMEAFHNYTFEGDDYPDDVTLFEGTTENLTEWAEYYIKMRSAPLGANAGFMAKVAQNVLDAL